SFEANVRRLRTKPEDVMPWKVNGERWHLGDKGFPPGQKVRWERPVLSRLLDLVRRGAAGGAAEVEGRERVKLVTAGGGGGWAGRGASGGRRSRPGWRGASSARRGSST